MDPRFAFRFWKPSAFVAFLLSTWLLQGANAWAFQENFALRTSLKLDSSRAENPKTLLTYRNHPMHEEHLTEKTDSSILRPPTNFLANLTAKKVQGKSSMTQTFDGINHQLIRDLIFGQLGFLGVAMVFSFGTFSLLPTHTIAWLPHHQHQSVIANSLLVIGSVMSMLGAERIVDSLAQRSASRVHFDTTNMVVNLFGRRDGAIAAAPPSSSTSPSNAMKHTCLLTAVTAVAQETIFRFLVPSLLFHWTHSPTAALVGQALFFGLHHVSPVSRPEENQVLFAMQTANGLIYAGLLASTGGLLWPCVLAHMLYDMHVLTYSWHSVNDQIDWAHDHSEIDHLSKNDAKVLAALQEHSRGALTTQSMQTLHRFFYAFDTDHKGYLSLKDVQKAISYSFWTMEIEPSEAQVEDLFKAILLERPPDADIDQPSDRLSWVEFVRLLVSLRAHVRRQIKERQQQQKQEQPSPKIAF